MTGMTHALVVPLLAGLGPSELIIIALVIVLLFGASKLPELARGSGRALRIFKAETKGLTDDDDEDDPEKSKLGRKGKKDKGVDGDKAATPATPAADGATPGVAQPAELPAPTAATPVEGTLTAEQVDKQS